MPVAVTLSIHLSEQDQCRWGCRCASYKSAATSTCIPQNHYYHLAQEEEEAAAAEAAAEEAAAASADIAAPPAIASHLILRLFGKERESN